MNPERSIQVTELYSKDHLNESYSKISDYYAKVVGDATQLNMNFIIKMVKQKQQLVIWSQKKKKEFYHARELKLYSAKVQIIPP